MDSKAVLQAIEVNPVSSTQRVSGELDISVQSGLSPLRSCPVGWGCRIHQLLCRGIRIPNECPVYDNKCSLVSCLSFMAYQPLKVI